MPSSTCARARPMSLEAGLPVERARQRADHQHQARRVERLGLVDGPAVVVQRRAQARRIGGREEAAAAVAGERDAGVLDLLGDRVEAGRVHLVAPGPDGADAARARRPR